MILIINQKCVLPSCLTALQCRLSGKSNTAYYPKSRSLEQYDYFFFAVRESEGLNIF